MIHPPTSSTSGWYNHPHRLPLDDTPSHSSIWAFSITLTLSPGHKNTLILSDFFNSRIIYGVRLGRGGKEPSSAHENQYSLVHLENKPNLTVREVSLLEANSSCGSVGYSFTIGIVSGFMFRVRVQIWPLTVNHISKFHHVSLFRIFWSSFNS